MLDMVCLVPQLLPPVVQVIPGAWLRLFNPAEMNELLSGGAGGGADADDMRAHATYSGGYSDTSRTIVLFWQARPVLRASHPLKPLLFAHVRWRSELIINIMVAGTCMFEVTINAGRCIVRHNQQTARRKLRATQQGQRNSGHAYAPVCPLPLVWPASRMSSACCCSAL